MISTMREETKNSKTKKKRNDTYDAIFEKPNLLDFLTGNLEFVARVIFCNLPVSIIAAVPEIDRFSSCCFAYFIMQVVAFCYACLVNASFALACEITNFLPPLTQKQQSSQQSLSIFDKLGNGMEGYQLMSKFYISYASMRIVIIFATNVFNIALESLIDFPDLAKVLEKNRLETLWLAPNIFIPSIILELGIVTADPICSFGESKVDSYFSITQVIAKQFCNHTGLQFFTCKYPEIRRLTFVAVMIMVIQLFQIAMNQFPMWDKVLKKIHWFKKFLFQVTVLILVIFTIAAILFSWIQLHDFVSVDIFVLVLIGWTLWLFAFSLVLIKENGRAWAENQNLAQDIIDSAVIVRISHMLILFAMFSGLFFFHGFPRAQLDLTTTTIVLPTLYCAVYIFCSLSVKAGSTLIKVAFPVALGGSLFINMFAQQYAKGSVILVFCHLFGKLIQYFGDDGDHDDDEFLHRKSSIDEEETSASSSNDNVVEETISNGHDDNGYGNYIDHEEHGDDLKQKIEELIESYGITNGVAAGRYNHKDLSTITEGSISPKSPTLSKSEGNISQYAARNKVRSSFDNTRSSQSFVDANRELQKRSSDALSKLAIRGTEPSPLVSLNLPPNVRNHWLVKTSKENVSSVSRIARAIAIPDSILSGFIRAFIGVGVIFVIILVFLGLTSELQKNLEYFPSFIDFHKGDNGSLLIDHKISNITFFPRQDLLNKSNEETCPIYETPHYGICKLDWSGLSAVDFGILSELAYFDEDEEEVGKIQNMVDLIFPDLDFQATLSQRKISGPMFLEVTSTKLNLTVISIRGTDIGRMNDFMEDIKLYAEPIIFTLLSCAFPTIRLWSTDTTSKVIEWLFQFNAFFGLQGEALYYLALTQHVFELEKDKTKSVFLTGHSLGYY